MFIAYHDASDSRTFISYADGTVTIKVTDPTYTASPQVNTYSLAVFLRAIGIPFKAVRAITSGERIEEAPVA